MIYAMSVIICTTFLQRIWMADIWYSLPAIISISLVYAATRHEEMGQILNHALRTGLLITTFMAAFFALLWSIS